MRSPRVTGVQTCALPIDRKSTRLNSSHQAISYAVFCLRTEEDRKSTRLNSSHQAMSYAVFCLQKKRLAAAHPYLDAAGRIRRAPQRSCCRFFFNDRATPEISTLSLHAALPI